jgi:hypothetical protein
MRQWNYGQKVMSKVDPTGLVVIAWKSFGCANAWSLGQLLCRHVLALPPLLMDVSTVDFQVQKKKERKKD